jgi:thiamine-monophosphate kinase
MKVSDIGEFALIDRIRSILDDQGTGTVSLGIGDDASIMACSPGMELVVSADLLVEDVHFKLDSITPADLGYKALAVNLSDLAAMGAAARQALVCLSLPPDTPVSLVEELYRGMLEISAGEFPVSGGDLSLSTAGITLSITVLGEVEKGKALRRDKAQPGDVIFVSGPLGNSAAGLEILGRPDDSLEPGPAEVLVLAHNLPYPELALGRHLVTEGLSACAIDISDGLMADLGHICRQSGVGAKLDLEKIPVSQALLAYKDGHMPGALNLALTGGEDYRLLFTVPEEKTAALDQDSFELQPIGTVTAGKDIELFMDGEPYTFKTAGGYDHFS